MSTPDTYVERAELLVGKELVDVVENEALPASGVDPERFWRGLSELIHVLSPRNTELLSIRPALQASIDAWHRQHPGEVHDADGYRGFLEEIGYLAPAGPAFTIDTDRLDPEISTIAGPQLVVPVTNARDAIDAANARWGSLYDAVYGTDCSATSHREVRTMRPAAPGSSREFGPCSTMSRR